MQVCIMFDDSLELLNYTVLKTSNKPLPKINNRLLHVPTSGKVILDTSAI